MRLFHITQAANCKSIDKNGLRGSTGWLSGNGVYVTTNPIGWIFIFEEDGVYPCLQVDIWEIN